MVINGLYYADDLPISVVIEDGLIKEISRSVEGNETPEFYLAPGLIDHQVNGYLSHSFVGGELNAEALREVIEGFWSKGITTLLPTLTTQTNERLLKGFEDLNRLLQDQQLAQSIPGFHLEGPYISPEPGFRGVHNPDWIRNPDWEEFERYYHASGNRIKEVTIAPEMEGAMEFIRKCREHDIVVAIGHSGCSGR